jgi:hypothetical protein
MPRGQLPAALHDGIAVGQGQSRACQVTRGGVRFSESQDSLASGWWRSAIGSLICCKALQGAPLCCFDTGQDGRDLEGMRAIKLESTQYNI